MCISTRPASRSAQRGPISGSPRSAVTSLTIEAPASRAASATADFEVSTDTVAVPANPAITRTTPPRSTSPLTTPLRAAPPRPRPSRFPPHVQDLCSLLHKLATVPDRHVGIEKQPPIREGIGSDVDDAHEFHRGSIARYLARVARGEGGRGGA